MSKRLKVRLSFLWFDFWVGFFYDRTRQILYFCPLPMIVFSFRLEEIEDCPNCEKELEKIAYMDDGWILETSCECGYGDYIDWPFGEKQLSGKDLQELGFIIL